MDKKEKLNRIFLILLSLFVVMLGYGILLPILPYYTERLALKDDLDPDLINYHIGMLTSIYPLFQLIFVIVWGRLSDKYGRKSIILFTSSVIPVSNAYLSDITSEKRRTKIMAWSGVAISSGLIFGPVLGGLLSQTNVHLKYSFGLFHLDRFSVPFFLLQY
mgnify:CR=1 FL=1